MNRTLPAAGRSRILTRRVLGSTAVLALAVTGVAAGQSIAPQAQAEPLAASAATAVSDLPVIDVTLKSGTALSTLNGGSKATKYGATISYTDPSGATASFQDYSGEIKGRGNFTWTLAKKPYQIKFDKSTPGDVALDGMKAERTWVLLANHDDPSLLRNNVAFDVSSRVGMNWTPSANKFVDLKVNGKYLGTYQLTEKVEVKKKRVKLSDDKGVLVELDNHYYTEEPRNFVVKHTGSLAGADTHFVLKDSKSDPDAVSALSAADKADATKLAAAQTEAANAEAGYADIQAKIKKLDTLLSATTPDWSAISSLIDVDSFVKYYYIAELTENGELAMTSVYFYEDGTSDKLHIGPAWDYDVSQGNFSAIDRGAYTDTNYAKDIYWLRGKGNNWYTKLLRNPEFVRAVDASYDSLAAPAYDAAASDVTTEGNVLTKSAAKNFATWPILGKASLLPNNARKTSSTYSGEVSYLSKWVSGRAAYLDGAYGGTSRPVLTYSASAAKTNLPTMTGGEIQGLKGSNLTNFTMKLLPGSDGAAVSGGIIANAHVQTKGWVGWKDATKSSIGASSSTLRVEGLQFALRGALAQKYDVWYRVYQNGQWLGWAKNGQLAGNTGVKQAIQGFEVQLVDKGTATPAYRDTASAGKNGSGTLPSVPKDTTAVATTAPTTAPTTTAPTSAAVTVPTATYDAHLSHYGWTSWVTNGQTAGGKNSASMEAFQLKLTGATYRAHVQHNGWLSWVSSGQTAGTTGQHKSLQALSIKLSTADAAKYDVYYRVHNSTYGWMGWAKNGADAGTTGYSLPADAYQVTLVTKGAAAPGSTSNSFLSK